jgi:phosphoribosylformimino-5-aminoimidazole carboxamide ribotide isomerase
LTIPAALATLLGVRSLGVIDLRHGRAVRAVGGARTAYAPVTTVAGRPIPPGDARALAGAYVDGLGVDALYLADLDAILDAAPRLDLLRALASCGVPLWYDGAVASVSQARRARTLGAARVIVALETLPSHDALDGICGAIDGVAFGLDLRDGEPLFRPGATLDAPGDVEGLVVRALRAGADAVVAIDLARVGTASGPDDALVARVRAAAPITTIVAGGGVRHADDLARLAAAGCDGVLLGTTLHDGRLTREDLAAVRLLPVH